MKYTIIHALFALLLLLTTSCAMPNMQITGQPVNSPNYIHPLYTWNGTNWNQITMNGEPVGIIEISQVNGLQTALNSKASLTGTEELTNKTLTSSVLKGTFTWTGSDYPFFPYLYLPTIGFQSNTSIFRYVNNDALGIFGGSYSGSTVRPAYIYLTGGERSSSASAISFTTSNVTSGNSVAVRFVLDGKKQIATANWTSTNMSIGGQGGHLLDMEASGGGYYDVTSHSFVDVSSENYKTNIRTSPTNSLDKILLLQPVLFDWKKYNPPEYKIEPDGITQTLLKPGYWTNDGAKNQLGLIAEHVAGIDPALVSYTNDLPTGLNTNALISLLISAVKEQQAQIELLKAGK